MNILFIDDDIFLQKAISFSLLQKGHSLSIANNGLQAIEHLEKNNQVDVIICDVMMPEVSGPTFLLMLKKLFAKQMPVIIVVSGVRDGEAFLKKIEIKYDYFFRKPIDLYQLGELIDKIEKEIKAHS